MTKDNRSFFEKLTGIVPEENMEYAHTAEVGGTDVFEEQNPLEEAGADEEDTGLAEPNDSDSTVGDDQLEEIHNDEGQLTVDVYQTPTHIVVLSPMAGVKPDDVDVSINRDMITIRGRREQKNEAGTGDYYYRELFWGAFSRSVLLPQEVDSDHTEASFKAGLLTVKMPKIKKEGVQRVKVEAKEI